MQRKLFHAFGMVGFAALLALNLASCAGSKAAALPVASDLVPTENGWAFANYPSSAFPDVQFDTVDMLAMFGNDTNVCIDGIADPCTLTAEAATWAQMVNQSRASGSCMGLAVLAAQRFNDNVSPVTATLRSDEPTLRAVARAFATQFLSEAQAESEKWLQSSLGDIVETVKASLAENKVDYTLGLYASKGYVEANGLPATPEELKAHRRIGYVEDLIFTPSLNFTGEVMRDWNAGFEISSAIGQTEAVLAGAGIGILHSYIARQHDHLVRVLPEVTIRRAYWTTFHESARELVRVRAVVQFLQDAVEQDRAIFG